MTVADRDADENEPRLDLYLSSSNVFSSEMPSPRGLKRGDCSHKHTYEMIDLLPCRL